MNDGGTDKLGRISLLSDLPPGELLALARSCAWKRYSVHEQIIDRQSDTRDICFVAEGRVRVVNYSLSGREVALDDVEVGGHFGELAALDGRPRSASVMALTDSVIASMPADVFLDLMVRYPETSLKVMRHLAAILRVSTDRIMDLSTLGANNRVHAELLREARGAMVGENEALIKPIPVHGDIASRVSTTRETVARVLSDLARQGIVERQADGLALNDMAALEKMVVDVRGA